MSDGVCTQALFPQLHFPQANRKNRPWAFSTPKVSSEPPCLTPDLRGGESFVPSVPCSVERGHVHRMPPVLCPASQHLQELHGFEKQVLAFYHKPQDWVPAGRR